MKLHHLSQLKRSTSNTAESFRGVDMDTYVALRQAVKALDDAIVAAKKHYSRPSKSPLPLKTLFQQPIGSDNQIFTQKDTK